MKITDLTLKFFAWDDIPATTYGKLAPTFEGSTQLGLLTISTDEGIEGHAFLGNASRGADLDGLSIVRHLKPVVVGKHPLDRERMYQELMSRQRYTTLRAIGAVDVALWDLGGKIAGLPIHRMIGSYRESVPAYASSAVLDSPEAYAEQAAQYKADGWAAYKIHPPTESVEGDIAVCRAVREAVGDDYRIMLDSTWAYDYPDALRVGLVAQELNFYWYEDPFAEDDIGNYVKLRQNLDIPLMATEYSPGGFTNYAPWLMAQATDYLRGDVAVKGGITAILKGAHLAEAFHMNYEVHHGGNSLNNVANLHVIMAIKNCEYFEVLLPAGAQKYGLIEDIDPDENGLVHAFNQPGLGAQIDFELIERKQTAVLS